ncbi:MAG: CoA pyrophosphatase [Chloroflexi bacterium]|nr:CoA pyrophosphatase [Chloroflexota bacterium]MCI0800349.1 CoA pyrophosphatase [Chloroflexota bacterium]MCI0810083.1 CoA pyrophosphatase [Chloroflexota bacterium]MCI0828693.1 CoA pyrophosphatase [Chloroflexota bacterium]MCI0899595.1 CoA pyrophosphatase [Chloroflexota bacterium]
MGQTPPELLKRALANRVVERVDGAGLTPSAVMVLFYPKDGEYCILLNKRSEQVEHHKGEISFPGGARDPEDRDALETALRETEEEMGIKREDITVIGEMDEVATRSNFRVQVFAGTIEYPYTFNPSAIEIAEVLEFPVPALIDPANRRVETRWENGQPVTSYSYVHGEHVVFGATARILQSCIDILDDRLESEGRQVD